MASGNIIGLILSLAILLGLCISCKWAVVYSDLENVTISKEIPNRVAAPAELTADSVDKWGAVPGQFDSVYSASVNVSTYAPSFLSSERLNDAL